ncbi:MAG: hypothetical protein P1S46_06135 [bacterium]|nr:hypothetical protein [bacterium]
MTDRNLTPADVSAILDAMQERALVHQCRYSIPPEKMENLINFIDSIYDGTKATKRTILAVTVAVVVTGTIGLVLTGIWARVREMIGQ